MQYDLIKSNLIQFDFVGGPTDAGGDADEG